MGEPEQLVGEGHPSWGGPSAATTAAPVVVLGYAFVASAALGLCAAAGDAQGVALVRWQAVAGIAVSVGLAIVQLRRVRWARWAFPVVAGVGLLVALDGLRRCCPSPAWLGTHEWLPLEAALWMLATPTSAATKLSFRVPVPAQEAATLAPPRPDAARLALAMPAFSTALLCFGAALLTGSAFDMLKPFHLALSLAAFAFALSGLRTSGALRWRALGVATVALALSLGAAGVEHRAAQPLSCEPPPQGVSRAAS